MNLLQSIILAIIEGITEYLPISSTGHMILASSVMGIASDPFVKFFTVAVQLGAILAVVVLYFKRFFKDFNFYIRLAIAFIPSIIFGLLLSDFIDSLLENPLGVAIALFLGGIILIKADDWFRKYFIQSVDDIDYIRAIKIGLFQCLAMIPGVSRSGATIIGGMTQKLNRKTAAEFSFFLAVPTMFAATAKKGYDFYKSGFTISPEQWKILAVGNVVAFVVAMLAIKFFIDFLTKYGFKIFGWYRIVVGLVIIVMILSGVKLQIV